MKLVGPPRLARVAALVHLGKIAEAQAVADDVMAKFPAVTITFLQHRWGGCAFVHIIIDALRKINFPEG